MCERYWRWAMFFGRVIAHRPNIECMQTLYPWNISYIKLNYILCKLYYFFIWTNKHKWTKYFLKHHNTFQFERHVSTYLSHLQFEANYNVQVYIKACFFLLFEQPAIFCYFIITIFQITLSLAEKRVIDYSKTAREYPVDYMMNIDLWVYDLMIWSVRKQFMSSEVHN